MSERRGSHNSHTRRRRTPQTQNDLRDRRIKELEQDNQILAKYVIQSK